MLTRLTDTDKKQQMCSTRISNIAVKVTLYVHQIEFNLVYEKSNGLALTLLVFQNFPLIIQKLTHILAEDELTKINNFIIEIINTTGIRN
jgi:hypothetical protein